MVKNTTGGSKAKGMASKHFKPKSKVLRLIQEDGEMYGVITEKLGGGHVIVACMDNTRRMAVIGKKFRNERIAKNQMVMIGLRDWQTIITNSDKLEKCDLLECYSDIETDALLHKYGPTSSQMIHLVSKFGSATSSSSTDDVLFTDDTPDPSLSIPESVCSSRQVDGGLLTELDGTCDDSNWFDSI